MFQACLVWMHLVTKQLQKHVEGTVCAMKFSVLTCDFQLLVVLTAITLETILHCRIGHNKKQKFLPTKVFILFSDHFNFGKN